MKDSLNEINEVYGHKILEFLQTIDEEISEKIKPYQYGVDMGMNFDIHLIAGVVSNWAYFKFKDVKLKDKKSFENDLELKTFRYGLCEALCNQLIHSIMLGFEKMIKESN